MSAPPIVLGLAYDDMVRLDDLLCDYIKVCRRSYPMRWDELQDARRLVLEIRRQTRGCLENWCKETA